MTNAPKPHRQNMPACYRELIALAIVARTTGPIYGTRLSPEPGDATTFVPSTEDEVKNMRAWYASYTRNRRARGVNPEGVRLPGDDEIDAEIRRRQIEQRRARIAAKREAAAWRHRATA